MTKRIVSGIFILTALGALGIILAGALTSGEQLIVRFLTAVVVAALGLYVISDLRLQADDDAASARNRKLSRRQPASIETAPNSTAAFMATVTTKKQEDSVPPPPQASPIDQRAAARPARSDRRSVLAVGDAPTTGRPTSDDRAVDPDLTRTRIMAVASAPETTVLDDDAVRRAVASAANGPSNGPAAASNGITNGLGSDPVAPTRQMPVTPAIAEPVGPTPGPASTPGPLGIPATAGTNGVAAASATSNGTATNSHHQNGANGSGRNGVSLISGNRRLSSPLGGFDRPGDGESGSNSADEAGGRKADEARAEAPVLPPVIEPFEAPLEAITTARIPNLEELAALGPRPSGGPNGVSGNGADGSTTIVIPMADLPNTGETGDDDSNNAGADEEARPAEANANASVDVNAGVDANANASVEANAANVDANASLGVDVNAGVDVAADASDTGDPAVATPEATVAPAGLTAETVAEHDWPMPGHTPAAEIIDVTTTDDEPVAPAPVALAPTSRPPARRLPTPAQTGADAADYADAPLAPIIDLREVHTLNAHGNIDNAIKAGELEVISTLIEQGMLSTDGPVSDRDVRTMVYVAFTSNELRKLLLAGGSPDRPNHGLDLGPVELFDERQHAPIPKTIYPGKPRVIESGQDSARSQLG